MEAIVVVAARREERSHGASVSGNDVVGAKVGQGREHETAVEHVTVRNRELRGFDLPVTEENDIEVDRAWAPNANFFAAVGLFDLLKDGKQRLRGEVGLELQHRVHKVGLIGWPERSRTVQAGTPKHPDPVLAQTHRDGFERPARLAQIGTQCHVGTLDHAKSFASLRVSRQGGGLRLRIDPRSDSCSRVDVIELARRLVRIPSVTNHEGEVARFVAERLRSDSWHVTTQEVPVEGDENVEFPRLNVLAQASEGPPKVVLTTHLDTVPPFIDLDEDGECLYGRGTCDAKGIFAAQWIAAERLRSAGMAGVALLGLVGEETHSWGAQRVSEILPRADWIVDGEPTDLKLASGGKGVLGFTARARGKACHSAFPELGLSAVHELIAALARLLKTELPHDPFFGATTVNVGRVQGGLAPNVLSPTAEAHVTVRLGAPADAVLDAVRDALGSTIEVEVTNRADPHRIHVPGGHRGEVVRFGSDVPYLRSIGTPLLVGPGSIHDAHTDHEKVKKADLSAAVELYAEVAWALAEG